MGETMQQHPDAVDSQRTQPAVPGATLPTLPMLSAAARSAQRGRPLPPLHKQVVTYLPLLPLLCFAFLIELCLLALLPLFALLAQPHDALVSAFFSALPWVSHLFWTAHPSVVRWLAALPWLSLRVGTGSVYLLIGVLLAAALCCALLAALLGRQSSRKAMTRQGTRALCLLACIGSGLFGLTLLFAPVGVSSFSQDMMLYGLYGRIVTVYHLNLYTFAASAIQHDLFYPLLAGRGVTVPTTAPYGPVWLDLCLFVTLLAGNSVVKVLLGFRLLGLIAHVANTLLLWRILGKVKPETRLMGTLLYAWNPLVLLFSVLFMHEEVVLVLCLLLAVYFLQRESPTLSWVLLLLAALMSSICLLLIPIFLRMLLHESRILYLGRRLLWWTGMGFITALVVALAYAPYERGWSVAASAAIGQLFAPATPVNSLATALLHLPVELPAPMLWLLAPHHWVLLALLVGVSILLLGLWLADTLGMALLFSCWLLLCGVVLLPIYWPWYVLLPLALALCSGNGRTIAFAVLLAVGGLLSSYYELWPSPWAGQGLLTLALPLVLWGWLMFFTSTWQMARPPEPEKPVISRRTVPSFSRPSWLSRPSRPGRR
jgi:hypothetical protein